MSDSKLFPVFTRLEGKKVVIVGAGDIAARKIALLQGTGAVITVGARHIGSAVLELASASRLVLLNGEYDPQWLDEAWLVIAATNQRALNERIARDAEARRIWVNVVDTPELCGFQVPAMVERGPLTVAISSGGHAPVIARRIREQLETLLDHSLGALITLAARYRPKIRQARPGLAQRRRFYEWLLDGPVMQAVSSGHTQQAQNDIEAALDSPESARPGHVSLVGAGPGDPGLLTLKGLRALNQADVILYDRLVSPDILDLARRDATRISVGKQLGEDHEATQKRIHELMRQHAEQGLRVVRLKGGDPFIFGRGGEELQYLRQHGIGYDVVPGLTSALAGAAYAGIPLTHRDHAQALKLVTAHCQSDHDLQDWDALARPNQTVVFYMGVKQMASLTQNLLAHGRSRDTPIALIENATRPQQRVLHGTLSTMTALAREHSLKAPALIVVGDVTTLGQELAWFATPPRPRTAPELSAQALTALAA